MWRMLFVLATSFYTLSSFFLIDHYVLFILMQWGYVVITTPDGVLDHEEAAKRNVGGQVLGYFH